MNENRLLVVSLAWFTNHETYGLAFNAGEEEDFEEGNYGTDNILVENEESDEPSIVVDVLIYYTISTLKNGTQVSLTFDGILVLGQKDGPEDERRDVWEGVRCSVKNTEGGAIVRILSWRREHLLESSSARRCLACVVRVMQMHECVDLPFISISTVREDVNNEHTKATAW